MSSGSIFVMATYRHESSSYPPKHAQPIHGATPKQWDLTVARLAYVNDSKGRQALKVATKANRLRIYTDLLLLGRYEVLNNLQGVQYGQRCNMASRAIWPPTGTQ